MKAALALLLLMAAAKAHEHHDEDIPMDPNAPLEPIDSILWAHVSIMFLAFGMIFPIGMVLGLTRSKWHVPLQIVGVALATVGWFLGHAHGGRMFRYSAHAGFSWVIVFIIGGQTVAGLYLKLHWSWGPNKLLRKVFVPLHGITGKVIPLVGYVQMVLGGIAMLGFCYNDPGDHLGQCLAHFIMGSSFIAYGIVYIVSMRLLSSWFQRSGKSQEFYDSWVIMLWGAVNTFTEHRWGSAWSHKDFQHTSMGIIWWCAGLVGIYLSRRGKRSLIPAMVIFITGFAMSSHAQNNELSTKIHSVFGWTLMLGALARIIEISIILRDESGAEEILSWQHLPPYLLISGGFLFMGANEEQLALLNSAMIDPISYALVLFSLAFLVYLYAHLLITLYEHTGRNQEQIGDGSRVKLNGNGNPSASSEALAVRADGVQDFELGALLNEDDDDEEEETPMVKTEGTRF